MLGESWGATVSEHTLSLPCDELLPHAPVRLHRAVSIDASRARVFRWLCQLKLAPYSYDLLDNFGRRSPRKLTPGAERLELGQRFMVIFSLVSFAQDEHITIRGARTAVTYAVLGEGEGEEEDGDGVASTRLLARVLFKPPGGRPGLALIGGGLAVGDLVMMRKQLLTFKKLAELGAA